MKFKEFKRVCVTPIISVTVYNKQGDLLCCFKIDYTKEPAKSNLVLSRHLENCNATVKFISAYKNSITNQNEMHVTVKVKDSVEFLSNNEVFDRAYNVTFATVEY